MNRRSFLSITPALVTLPNLSRRLLVRGDEVELTDELYKYLRSMKPLDRWAEDMMILYQWCNERKLGIHKEKWGIRIYQEIWSPNQHYSLSFPYAPKWITENCYYDIPNRSFFRKI